MDTKLTSRRLGLLFVLGGGAVSIYHLGHIFGKKSEKGGLSYRIAGALTGGLCISIGANLIANSLHDKLLSEG